VNFDAERTKIAVRVLREFAREGHQLLVFTCHEHVWRLFSEIKADTRRIPNRFNKNQEFAELEALAAPPEHDTPVPDASETSFEPEPIEAVAAPKDDEEEVVRNAYDLKPARIDSNLDEVEYSWQDWPQNGANGWSDSGAPASTLRPWPAAPMIHRPDWW
jgi:hypothetical protein